MTLTIGLFLVALMLSGCRRSEPSDSTRTATLWELADAGYQRSPAAEKPANQKRFPVIVHKPSVPVIELKEPDPQGRVGVLACSTCHSVREPNYTNRTARDLGQFHQEMTFDHGSLVCLSCHNPRDYDTLRLADERTVEYPEVMTLCAQCHGPQATAYEHGAHGGMTGYWDLDRGPRVRNNCIDCHDPHVPRFPRMLPTFKPRDRFLSPIDAQTEHSHE